MFTGLLFGRLFLLILVAIILSPVFLLLGRVGSLSMADNSEAFSYVLGSDILFTLSLNTVALMVLVVLLSFAIGLFQATLIKLTRVSYKKTLSVLFVLPMTFPLYIFAFIYVGGFSYSGGLFTFFRNALGWDLSQLISTDSTVFVAFVFSLALSPYFFLFLSSALNQLNPRLLLSARSLGHSPQSVFYRLVLRYLRPWIFSASILVALDVLCDFGGVSIFGYETFTLAIYQSWLSFFSLEIAVLLSIVPMLFGIGLYYLGQTAKLSGMTSRHETLSIEIFEPTGFSSIFMVLALLTYFLLSLGFPVLQLVSWSLESFKTDQIMELLSLLLQTLGLGLLAAILVVILSVSLLFFKRHIFTSYELGILPLSNIGYAIPGTIIAVGLLYSASLFGTSFTGYFAFICLMVAYLSRFFSVSLQLVQRSLQKISNRIDWAGRSLGHTPAKVYSRVQLPLIRGSIFTAFGMVVIEVIKELPMTLILRPFEVDTLATQLYQYTAEGLWQEAAVPALIIVFAGVFSLFLGQKLNEVWSRA